MTQTPAVTFDAADTFDFLQQADDEALDALDFGVIAFDADTTVKRYNAHESRAAGLSHGRVLGHPIFTVVAPCMNNYMVAQRFEDAVDALDVTIDYVLTLRMRPVKVKLRLLAGPRDALRYVLVQRQLSPA
ncbi:MAG: phosphonate transporter [Variovorax sp.]|nr:MAG: phosphonate transporter [Variovorax sp.]